MTNQGRNPKRAILPIPPNMTPTERVCFTLTLPKESQHLAAFWGAFGELGRRYYWGKPLTADSETVAAFWQTIIDENRACYEEALFMANGGCGCCPEVIYRYTPDGKQQVSYDGGQTWEDYAGDSRFTGNILPPPPWSLTPGGHECEGAITGRMNMGNAIDEILTTGVDVGFSGLVGIVVAIICAISAGAACAVAGVVGGLVTVIVQVGASAIAAEMTAAVYDTFQCILYCHILPDATFNEAGWTAVKNDITDQLGGNAEFMLWNMVNALGPVGLTNLCRSSVSVSGNCDNCSCVPCDPNSVYLFNFVTSQWAQVTPEPDDSIILTSTSNGTREIIQFAFGQGYPGGDCCNVATYEQISGNQIFIVDYIDCADQQFSQAQPTPGCRKMVTIYSQLEPEPPQVWKITLAEECI